MAVFKGTCFGGPMDGERLALDRPPRDGDEWRNGHHVYRFIWSGKFGNDPRWIYHGPAEDPPPARNRPSLRAMIRALRTARYGLRSALRHGMDEPEILEGIAAVDRELATVKAIRQH